MTLAFDRRLTPARPDRAALHLRGRFEAAQFVAGEARAIAAPSAPLRREPRLDCALDTEALRGEHVTIFEETIEGWAWGQLTRDGYVGYLPATALGPAEIPTHRVIALRSFVFPAPDLKTPILSALSLGSRLAVREIVGGYAAVADGYVWAGHLAPLDTHAPDFVAVAERFLGVPYLWGGKTSLGIDCSGLVQLSLDAAGRTAPRDSDMQEAGIGAALAPDATLRRGDLVFWKGHVGMMRDAATLLHATGHAMMVISEPLAEARTRIRATTHADVSSFRRV